MLLHGHDTSPYVRRVRVLLRELGVPFTRDTENWAAPGIRQVSPLLRVPALRDEGQVLFDSRLIAAYLYAEHAGRIPAPPAGLLPLQGTLFRPAQRWADENVLLALDTALDSAINVFLLERDGVTRDAAPYLRRQAERVGTALTFVEESYGGRPGLGEGALSFTDIALVCTLDWMRFRDRHDIAAHPGLLRVLEAHGGRPALAETHPSLATTGLPPAPAPPR
jgi:glutathione S-transferase